MPDAKHAQKVVFVRLSTCWVAVLAQAWVLSSTALTVRVSLQSAESGSEKLFQADYRMLRGLHRLAWKGFL